MSDEYVQAESAQPPEFIPATAAAASAEPVAAAVEPEAAPNLLEAVHRAALEAEQAVIESQYSEGLGHRAALKSETQST